jgi:aminoglycoside phosphotransferase (APT) family kinase protein
VAETPGFMTRNEFIDYYAQESGRDLSKMQWYLVFGYFKLAVILQQIYARWHRGQTKDDRFANFNERVRNLILHAYSLSRKDDL